METDARSATSVLILAGGRGQRMGGRDKGLISWRGKPLIQWLCDAARPVTDDLLISCNRNHDAYAEHADRLVCDDDDTFPGPLAGIRAGLAAARHARLLVLPCDTPLIDSNLLWAMLHKALERPDQPLMLRQRGQLEPLFCVIPNRLAATFERSWQQGLRSPRQVLLAQSCALLDLDDTDPRLANLNDPTLLRQALPDGT